MDIKARLIIVVLARQVMLELGLEQTEINDFTLSHSLSASGVQDQIHALFGYTGREHGRMRVFVLSTTVCP